MIEILAKIGFDWQIALANLVNFLVIFYLLQRFIFAPVARVLAERKKTIAEGVEKATEAEAALRAASEERERIVREARAEANTIIGAAEADGAGIREKRTGEAEREATAILDDARETLAKEKNRLESELKVKAVDLALQGAEAILKERIDAPKNAAIAKEAIGALRT